MLKRMEHPSHDMAAPAEDDVGGVEDDEEDEEDEGWGGALGSVDDWALPTPAPMRSAVKQTL